MSEYANAFARGANLPSSIQANLTKSAANKAARETLQTNKDLSKWNSDLEVLVGSGMFNEEPDGTITLTPDAIDQLGKVSDGNRDAISKSLMMNEMMGTYHAETPDGQLEKKRNQQVYVPVLAKKGAVPFSVAQAAAAGDANAIALEKQYKDGTLRGYVTPAINQEGLFSLLNVFGSDKADDQPQVATKEEILAGLQARADKMNVDGDILMPDRERAIRNQKKVNQFDMSNMGGGSDQGFIELVNGVFDENVGRGTTNAFLKNLQTMYAANPQYTTKSVAKSSVDETIEAGSEQDVMVDVQGAAKTFEQAYPTLQGLDGERLATELENLQKEGKLNNLGEQQQEQIFTDLQKEGIGSIPDLVKKRQEQKVSIQDQYKEILMLNTVASRPDKEGKLVLPSGKTPKEATDEMFNQYYTGAPGATLSDLATAQDNRRTNIREDQIADTNEMKEKRTFYTAMTTRLKNQDANALEWRKQIFTENKYYSEIIAAANTANQKAWQKNQDDFTTSVSDIKSGKYGSGITFDEVTKIIREMTPAGDINNSKFLFRTSSTMEEDLEKTQKVRTFINELDSITKDYFNDDKKGEVGSELVAAAYEAHMANAGDDPELKENFQKMWAQDGHNIYTYNYAQAGGFLEHKFMQEEVITQKIMMSLQNPESLWTTIIGWTGLGGQAPGEYIGDVGRNDLQGSALLNSLKDSLAIVYEGGNPIKIVAMSPNGEELEESLPLSQLINSQAISGLEWAWMQENLTQLGDTEGKPKKDKEEEGPDTEKDSESKQPLQSTLPIVPNLSNLPSGSGV